MIVNIMEESEKCCVFVGWYVFAIIGSMQGTLLGGYVRHIYIHFSIKSQKIFFGICLHFSFKPKW